MKPDNAHHDHSNGGALNNPHPRPKRYVDPFTARVGTCVLLAIAAGFLLFAIHALATGCIQLKSGPHARGIAHCRPETSYWVASLALLVLGCALVLVCGKLFGMADRRSRGVATKR